MMKKILTIGLVFISFCLYFLLPQKVLADDDFFIDSLIYSHFIYFRKISRVTYSNRVRLTPTYKHPLHTFICNDLQNKQT